MPGLALGWRYLTGHAVATDVSSRDRPEWPPHPARVFMALAAAWFETEPDEGSADARKDWEAEGEALRWLEALGDPILHFPPEDGIGRRQVYKSYVPVNDEPLPGYTFKLREKELIPQLRKTQPIQACPSVKRLRQSRTFPKVWVGEHPCFLLWLEVDTDAFESHRPALERLCAKVTRIGHSSSLVQMWVAGNDEAPSGPAEMWESESLSTELRVRPVLPGLLSMLEERYGEALRRRAASLEKEIATLEAERKATRGKGARERKQALKQRIQQLEQERAEAPFRQPIRPTIGLWRGYRRVAADEPVPVAHTVFDHDMLVLALEDGPTLPATATLLATGALRNAILRGVHDHRCKCDRWRQAVPSAADAAACWSHIPAWVSGHEPDGSPLQGGEHLAIVALPFVGLRHADGHLLGLALVFPRGIDRRERGEILGPLLIERDGTLRSIELALGRAGKVSVVLKDPDDTRSTLVPETWTGLGSGGPAQSGSALWVSATPAVLDRLPQADRRAAPAKWRAEVARIIASSCERVGVPAPVAVEVGTTSWLSGSPRAFPKRRPLRSMRGDLAKTDAPLGDGYPFFSRGNGRPPRPQVHARIEFSEPVTGPVILGAGRFRGYGLFRPVRGVVRR